MGWADDTHLGLSLGAPTRVQNSTYVARVPWASLFHHCNRLFTGVRTLPHGLERANLHDRHMLARAILGLFREDLYVMRHGSFKERVSPFTCLSMAGDDVVAPTA